MWVTMRQVHINCSSPVPESGTLGSHFLLLPSEATCSWASYSTFSEPLQNKCKIFILLCFVLLLQINFIEVQLTNDKMYPFEMHISMSFDKFIHPYNHHHEQENEHFYYPKKFSCVPSQPFCCF